MKTSKNLILNIAIAFVFLNILEIIEQEFDPIPYLTPVLFSLAIIFSLDTSLFRKLLFVILSIVIYNFAFYIACIDQYWGPKIGYLTLGTTIGALLEVMAFAFLYTKYKNMRLKHLFLTLIFGVISFSLPAILFKDYFITGYAIWYSGIAYVMYSIYTADKK